MGETNEEPFLFSQIDYIHMRARIIQAERELREQNERLQESLDQLLSEEKVAQKKPFKFLQKN